MATILITGSTDGIGRATAHRLVSEGHQVVLHGRDPGRLEATRRQLDSSTVGAVPASLVADLSDLHEVRSLTEQSVALGIDVLVNNAGVFRSSDPLTKDGLDVRFVVNTIAPYLLARVVASHLGPDGRIVNLSSAAQAPVDLDALAGRRPLDASAAYAQSKLALTMWSNHLAAEVGSSGPMVVAVNPGSMLGTKMVRDGFGVQGNDVGIGADVVTRAATADSFAAASGRYFDNDSGRFADPHPDALDPAKNAALVAVLDDLIARFASN